MRTYNNTGGSGRDFQKLNSYGGAPEVVMQWVSVVLVMHFIGGVEWKPPSIIIIIAALDRSQLLPICFRVAFLSAEILHSAEVGPLRDTALLTGPRLASSMPKKFGRDGQPRLNAKTSEEISELFRSRGTYRDTLVH